MQTADAIIIGSGQGGVPLAIDFARRGKRAVLFERGKFGGSCVNYGCTPSKTFLASAHGAGRARRLLPLGVRANLDINFAAVMDRVRQVRNEWEVGVVQKLHDANVQVIKAQAAFNGPRTVNGGGVTVSAPVVVIDTGMSPRIPDIPGLQATPYLTNLNFFELRELPRRLIVLGAGYIGLELGQGMARLGSEVQIIDTHERVLNREEPEASAILESSLRRDGILFSLGCNIASVAFDGKTFRIALDDETILEGEALLVAIGQTPNTSALNAKTGDVALDDNGYVVINEHMQTSCEGVYAIGDVSGQPAFTHVSWEDYRRVKAILAGEPRTRDDRVLGYTTFTEPQVARVGLDMDQAAKKGINARSVSIGMADIARAIEWGEHDGYYRLLINEDTDEIIGATMVGYEAGELVAHSPDLCRRAADPCSQVCAQGRRRLESQDAISFGADVP
jgi:pyruvate/2-oxoglutarate dehydrogenase complex dihydrolipoamide dehydrogenase (E3) component